MQKRQMKWIVLCAAVAAFAALAGCASRDPNLKRISGPTLVIQEKLVFSAISGDPTGPRYYHALKPGHYKAAMEDLGGTYYLGDGALLVVGAEATGDEATREPLASGGFWLAKGTTKDTSPAMRLFYLPNFRGQPTNADGVVVNTVATHKGPLTPGQGAVAGALSGVIIGAIVDSGAVGYGPKNGEPLFVPRKTVEEEEQMFARALTRARSMGSQGVP